MGASLALAGLAGCTRQPEENRPVRACPRGDRAWEAVVLRHGHATRRYRHGRARGKSWAARRKLRESAAPCQPGSHRRTDAGGGVIAVRSGPLAGRQPCRAHQYLERLLTAISTALETQRVKRGAGLRILTDATSSPTLAQQFDTLFTKFPLAVWHQYEPLTADAVPEGTRLAFGEALNPLYHVEHAEVIVALEADFLTSGPGCVRYARAFAGKRQVSGASAGMNRLYVVESTPSLTGAMADHRLPLRASAIADLAHTLAAAVAAVRPPHRLQPLPGHHSGWRQCAMIYSNIAALVWLSPASSNRPLFMPWPMP